jgi:hypothetical protein
MIMRRLNKLSASYAVIKTDKKNRRAITKHVLLRNMVLQRCSFFVSFAEKIKINALHIIFYTIFELRPPCKLLSSISPVVQIALICINYARFQVPVPVSLYRGIAF